MCACMPYRLSQLLYPTLIAACYQMEENKAILQEEISSRLLVTFLQDACRAEAKAGGGAGGRAADKSSAEKASSVADFSFELQHRFPKAHWEKAVTYFSQPS